MLCESKKRCDQTAADEKTKRCGPSISSTAVARPRCVFDTREWAFGRVAWNGMVEGAAAELGAWEADGVSGGGTSTRTSEDVDSDALRNTAGHDDFCNGETDGLSSDGGYRRQPKWLGKWEKGFFCSLSRLSWISERGSDDGVGRIDFGGARDFDPCEGANKTRRLPPGAGKRRLEFYGPNTAGL